MKNINRLEEFIKPLQLSAEAEEELRELLQLALLEACMNSCKNRAKRPRL
jgi:hypothetical protein